MSKKTLIIDDDEMSRGLLRMVLEYDGFNCVEANNGAHGLSILESHPFDVVILDYVMPVMDGMEFLSRLRQVTQPQPIPVIMLTAYFSDEIRQKATSLGAYAIIGKPYDMGELRSMIAQLCPSSASSPSASSAPWANEQTKQVGIPPLR